MVEIAKPKSSASEDDNQPRIRILLKVRRKLEVIGLKIKIENSEEEEKKFHFLLKEMGEKDQCGFWIWVTTITSGTDSNKKPLRSGKKICKNCNLKKMKELRKCLRKHLMKQ